MGDICLNWLSLPYIFNVVENIYGRYMSELVVSLPYIFNVVENICGNMSELVVSTYISPIYILDYIEYMGDI